MSCYIKNKNGQVEVRADNGSLSLLFEKVKLARPNETFKKQLSIYDKLKSLPTENVDINGEPNFKFGGDKYDDLLLALSSAGIEIKTMQEYEGEYELRNGKKLSHNSFGLADTINKVIAYAEGDMNALTEEGVHMWTATQRETSTYKRLEEQIVKHESYPEIYNKYMPIYKDEALVKKEAIDKLIIENILAEKRPQSVPYRIWQGIKSLLNKIKNVFAKPGLKVLIDDITSKITGAQLEVSKIKEDQLQYKLKEKHVKDMVFDDLIEAREQLINRLTSFINKNSSASDFALRDQVVQDINKSREDLFHMRTINHVQKRMKDLSDRVDSILKSPNPKRNEMATQLRKMHDLFYVYQPYIQDLMENKTGDKKFDAEVQKAFNRMTDFKNKYNKERKFLLGVVYGPIAKLDPRVSDEDVETMLEEGYKLSNWDRWFNAMADAKDTFLKVIDQLIKTILERVEAKSSQEINKLVDLYNKLEDKTFDRFYQDVTLDDGTTVKGRYLVDTFNTEQFQQNMNTFFDELRNRFLVATDYRTRRDQFRPGSKENIEFGKIILKKLKSGELEFRTPPKEGFPNGEPVTIGMINARWQGNFTKAVTLEESAVEVLMRSYKFEQAKWFKENSKEIPNVYQAIRKDTERILDKMLIGDLVPYEKEIRKFLEDNPIVQLFDLKAEVNKMFPDLTRDIKNDIESIFQEIKHHQDKNIDYTYRGERYFKYAYSQPNENYKADLNNLSKTDKEFLDYLHEMKQKVFNLTSNFDVHMVPQLHKSFQERFEGLDAVGIAKAIKESFRISEDETDFGADGDTIPVFFQKKLDYDDMSRDLITTFSAFIAMANHNIEFGKEESLIALSSEQAAERKIFLNKGIKEEDPENFTTGGNNYERLKDQILSTVYKESKTKNDMLKPKHVQLLDNVLSYVALKNLGFNMFSGVANYFTSRAIVMQEKIASKFVGDIPKSSWNTAAKLYRKFSLNNLASYGKANTENPFHVVSTSLSLLDEFYNDKVRTDIGKSRILNVLKQLPYSPNSIGEHMVQHLTALAYLDTIKVFKNGKLMGLPTALMESVEGTQMNLDGLIFEDGSPVTMPIIQREARRAKRLNKTLFGIYNQTDKSAAQRYILGRAVFQFRKFLVPTFNRRFQHGEFDYDLGIYKKGMYRDSWDFMKKMFTEYKQAKMTLLGFTKKELKELRNTPEGREQLKNLIRTMVEVINIAFAAAIGIILTKAAEEDEDDKVLAFMAYQANRHYREMSFYLSPPSFFEIMKSPVAAVSTLDSFYSLIGHSIDPAGIYSDDPIIARYNDGTDETYFGRNTKRLIPFYQSVNRLINADDQFNQTK
jgi:hypothetical protein